MSFRLNHFWILVALSLVTIAAHASGLQAYFCGKDDYAERDRAAFEDTRDPSRILTTSHFGTMKYRPVSRAVRYLTYRLAGDNPVWYRIRNLSFHVVNVLLVYALGYLLLGSKDISAAGALLFGVHPLVNQAMMGAFWTITFKHTVFLGSLFLFVWAARRPRGWRLKLGLAMFLALIGVFAYDQSIAVLGVMGVYLFLFFFRTDGDWAYPRGFFLAVIVSAIGVVAIFVTVRSVMVPQTWDLAAAGPPFSMTVMLKNSLIFMGALALPVDSVLANEWFGTPLPSDLGLRESNDFVIGAAAIGTIGLFFAGYFFLRRFRSKSRPPQWGLFDWRKAVFFIASILCCLAPLIVFQPKPSETYLYLPAAFYSLLLGYVLAYLLLPPGGQVAGVRNRAYWMVIAVFCFLSILATQVRNQRVIECGELAQRVEAGFRRELADGRISHVFVASARVPTPLSYGLYGLRGVDSIAGSTSWNLVAALRMITHDEQLIARQVPSEELETVCLEEIPPGQGCFWVYPDGKVERYLAVPPPAKVEFDRVDGTPQGYKKSQHDKK